MRGVSKGTGGLRTARGRCRAFLSVGIALCCILFARNRAWGQDSSSDTIVPQPSMSNREFIQNGQQNAAKVKKTNTPNDAKADEQRIADLIAQREHEREGDKFLAILVEGNTTIPTAAILQKVKTQPGRAVTVEQVRDDVRTLVKTRWFLTVDTRYRRTDKGLVLVFIVLERPIVRSVEYKGNSDLKSSKLAAQTGLKVGSPYDVYANREAAKRLESFYHEKDYAEATVELEKGNSRDDRDVIFRIHEGPKQKIAWREFEGNHAFSGDLLAMQLESTPAYGLLVGGKFDPAKLQEDVAKVRKYYENLGYFDAKVEPQVFYSKNRKWITLHYKIQEGVHYKIRSVNLTGNVRFTTQELQKEFKFHDGDFYNARIIGKDVANIRKKYGELGYTFITVEVIPRFLEQPGQVDLVLRIDEDKPYTIRTITFHIQGDHPRTKRSVAANYIGIAPGEPADPAKIEKSKKKISGAQVFKTDPTGGPVNIKMRKVGDDEYDKDPSVRGQSGDGSFESSIYGPQSSRMPIAPPQVAYAAAPVYSQPDAGRAEERDPFLDHETIDPWTNDLVVRAQSPDDPFASNPLFNPSPQGDPFSQLQRTPNGEIDLDYYLNEDRTGRLMFGVGVNSSAGLVGSIVLQEQNFDIMRPPQSWTDVMDGTAWRGAGQKFRVEAMPGTVVSRYTVSWSDPYFLNTNYNVGASGYYYQRYYTDQNGNPFWTEDRAGGRLTLGRQLTQQWSVVSALRLEGVRLSNPHIPTPTILEDSLGDHFLSTARAAVVHDTRDMPFMPGEGHRAEVGFEQAFGVYGYSKFDVNAQQYFTVYQRPDGGGRQILTVGGQLGWTSDDTPIFERFYAGGFQSFRGFYFRGVGPMSDGVMIGGDWMAIGTVEYSIPLLANEMLRLVVFSDFGTVQETVGLNEFRLSVGTGFRVALPMMGPVPLAFDFGIPIIKQPNDITQVFSFYVGLTR